MSEAVLLDLLLQGRGWAIQLLPLSSPARQELIKQFVDEADLALGFVGPPK
ncbi:MAG: hypothetical protein ACREXG_02525 [Polaromonas sp.]